MKRTYVIFLKIAKIYVLFLVKRELLDGTAKASKLPISIAKILFGINFLRNNLVGPRARKARNNERSNFMRSTDEQKLKGNFIYGLKYLIKLFNIFFILIIFIFR